MTMQPPAKFVTGRIMGNASEPIADPTSEMSQTPEKIKLDHVQRAEAELLIDRISTDEDALRDFVFAAIYFRADLETRLRAAEEERSAYWTVLELLCQRFPDRPIGDLPGSVDEQSARIASLEAELERAKALLFEACPFLDLLSRARIDSAAQSAAGGKGE